MCYASPGPRCYGHATEKLKKSQAKLSAAENAVAEMEAKAKEISVKNPKSYTNRADYRNLQAKIADGQTKLTRLKRVVRDDGFDADATTGGIEELTKRVNSLNPALDTEAKEHETLVARLKLAKSNYSHKLYKYDYNRGTVNGRNPSPYGSDEGIRLLLTQRRALVDRAAAATGEKKTKYEARIAAMDGQIVHAKETKTYAQSKITDYPSANLATNKLKFKAAQAELVKATGAYEKELAEYTNGPVQKMRDFIEEHKKAGVSARSKWSAADKRTYKNMEAEAEALWDEKVRPSLYRVRQFEGISKKLMEQINLGSITPKQRAEQVFRKRGEYYRD